MSLPAMSSQPLILIADDDPDDLLLMREAFEECGIPAALQLVESGDELLDYLSRRGRFNSANAPLPALILLDLNMPGTDGRDSLRFIKSRSGLRQIPVVVVTTSGANRDVLESYDSGANAYLRKPNTFEAVVGMVRLLWTFWFKSCFLPEVSGHMMVDE